LSRPFRIFVAGTDTGVGKTEASCALLSLLADDDQQPAPFKPYESGCGRLSRPSDAWAMKRAARSDDLLDTICPHRFRLPLAPGVAAQRLGRWPSFSVTLKAFRSFGSRPLVAEGAGGLFVPLDARRDVLDLMSALKLPVLLVARAGLGTLNHTALSLLALRRKRLRAAGVLLVKSCRGRDVSERDNARVLRERYGAPVLGPVPFLSDAGQRRAAFRRALQPLLQARARS
jgi:dethiobiotin synthetase